MRRVLILATTAIACLLCAGVATARTRLVADETLNYAAPTVANGVVYAAGFG